MIAELAIHLLTGVPVERFAACSWREWLACFPPSPTDPTDRAIAGFHP